MSSHPARQRNELKWLLWLLRERESEPASIMPQMKHTVHQKAALTCLSRWRGCGSELHSYPEIKAVRDRYVVIRGSGTWLMCLIIQFVVNIAFPSKAFSSARAEAVKANIWKCNLKMSQMRKSVLKRSQYSKRVERAWQISLHVFSLTLFCLFSFCL